ncbi:Oligoxyloglucan reducing end-specific cellobiohydrolase [Annulohypoxylon maeteangense]|uniref:Oligoxyloglucan reducing end-specific cellobiohydrolase n=1 Tax=Annulohypoxylon maeteangense TaxID=1927788 RepID=UPI0020083DDD|nr:Oligoxyloglucan reducing end-specific cellobiohydrolase [Annulohypoxylon maeteangense]KAI0882701.1 Oligoxyloglucan reducing end-specific cellobiohydrolase [Annulohypoxylon maeteangense]
MRARGASGAAASLWSSIFLLTALLWTTPTVYAKNGPTIVAKNFENPPNNLNYFKGSNVVLFQEAYGNTIWRSTDGGATWSKADGIEHDKAAALVMHEYDPKRAYVLTRGNLHWKTDDQGETWKTFFTDAYTSNSIDTIGRWMSFHADDHDKILFTGMDCPFPDLCEEVVMYTKNNFEDDAKFLRGRTQGCWWAKSSPLFTTGDDEKDKQRILCIVRGGIFSPQEDNRLLISDNFFSAEGADGVVQEYEPDLNGNGAIQGIVKLVEVKKFLLVAVTSRNTAEMALFVTGDTVKWHRAVFPRDHPILESSYTVLESTNYSIQIDVRTSKRLSNPMGTLLTSNSNGTYFTRNAEHTNRNLESFVDFEKVSNIQGIFLVNQVDNWKEVEEGKADKKIKTRITFDDGRTFESVKTGDEEIHLHSVTEMNNVGPVFSSPAPGLVMGNGNHGSHLKGYWESHLYISDDAGRTWIEGPKGPHKYEFGDQGSILLAVKDSEEADVKNIKYSLDHGKNWETAELPEGLSISPWTLLTTQDSTSLKFLLTARKGSRASPTGFYVISIDFEGLHENTCKDNDMEDWFARVDDDGNASCVMGHTQKYHRRKKDAMCFIKQEFKDPAPESSPCDCTKADFECDFNFVQDGDECKPAGPIQAPEGACKGDNPDEKFLGSSGWRLIPGNVCKRTGGDQKDKQKEWSCSDAKSSPNAPGSNKIEHVQFPFDGDFDRFDKHYLERGDLDSEDGETIIARPYKMVARAAGDVFVTHDHGKNWTKAKLPGDEGIYAIITHPYVKDMAFLLTREKKVFYTVDRGRHFDYFEPRDEPDTSLNRVPLAFHPDRPDWLIWHGKKCRSKGDCYLEASLSTDRGDSWETIKRNVIKCEFTGSSAYKFRNNTQILCLARAREDNEDNNPSQLLYSDEFPKYKMSVALENVIDFATMAEFIVVATENKTEGTLNALASMNGRDYAPAHFPFNFQVPHTNAYTVLDSSTHAVNLFVVTEEEENHRYGSILKSNSNGTSYVLSIAGVNSDKSYYVDFEKMLGLEGVVVVNTVENKGSDSEPKKLTTRISHNDGAEWGFLPPPGRDLDGKEFSCSSKNGDESCALHIHGYTERADHGKTYSSESAVGIMFGVGNVGPILGDPKDADTFMTADAGLSWKMVKKGSWTWSFGDQGSIVVLAQRNTRSRSISYSLDRGETWNDYNFSDSEVVITDITTLRSGSSRNFLLWGHQGDKLFTVNIDFSGLASEPCKDDEDREKSDYELWSPQHPLQPNGCLFGHRNQYLRKKKDRKCYNSYKLQHLYNVENCECTRQDFECDYNFEMDNHGHCGLVEGLQPLDPEQVCKDKPDEIEYYEPSGFRRIPLTTCKGGFEADKVLQAHPCPGHEEEFEKARGISGVGLFFAIVLPFGFASLAGWWVYRNWQSKFGQIRLGEQSAFNSDSPWVKYPVVAVSAVVAVIGAMPLLIGSLWRSVSSSVDRFRGARDSGGRYDWLRGSQRRYTTRDSFARGRGDYAIVDEDEGELLGDDSDDEV